jgi:hypothetical protein
VLAFVPFLPGSKVPGKVLDAGVASHSVTANPLTMGIYSGLEEAAVHSLNVGQQLPTPVTLPTRWRLVVGIVVYSGFW